MKRRFIWLWLVGLFIAGLAAAPQPVQAAGAGFTIKPDLPANQLTSASYFDLLVKPAQQETLTIYVTNTTAATETLKVSPVSAYTAYNGVLGYAPNQLHDNSATVTFKQMMSKPQTVTLAGKQTQAVHFTLKIPRGGFTGQVLGSLYVTEPTAHTTAKQSKGVSINNRFAMVIGVLLQTSRTKVTPQLKLNRVRPGTQANQAAVLANLQNTSPRLLDGMSLNAKIYRAGTKTLVKHRRVSGYSFAPNTNFDYGILFKKALVPGKYDLALTAKAAGRTWHFTRAFTITRQQSDRIAKRVGQKPASRINWWWLALGIILVLLLVIGWLLWLLLRRRSSAQK